MHKGLYWIQLLTGIGIGLIIVSLIWIFYPQLSPKGELQEVMPEREIVYYNISAFDLQVPKLTIPDGEERYAEIIDESELLLVYSSDYFQQSDLLSTEKVDTVDDVGQEVNSITTELISGFNGTNGELKAQLLDILNVEARPDLLDQRVTTEAVNELDEMLKADYTFMPSDTTEINLNIPEVENTDKNLIVDANRTEDVGNTTIPAMINTQIALNPEASTTLGSSVSEQEFVEDLNNGQSLDTIVAEDDQEIVSNLELGEESAEEVNSQPASEPLLAGSLEYNFELNPSENVAGSTDLFDTDLTLASEELTDVDIILAVEGATEAKSTSEDTANIDSQNHVFEDNGVVEAPNLDIFTEESEEVVEETGENKQVEFIIELGDSAEKIARNLKKYGIIKDEEEFLRVVRNKRLDRKLRAGGYLLRKNMSLTELVNELIK